ncbi:aryl-alcohol dehydrogenase-like predicted oxidoreductase [Altererythrobacter atlanticus]|uniref:General stress protein 69 n=1 Tax=Croceibacterium atlanticum TaxID=1267766 RepID=A0A0F7KUM5_9SPHN|nr:aldo/keto reductase [Croceibacterium atlanticum]AKH42947.1 General stress protein 69 [Croceibacterium atlanticum]MBB5734096.1 aryl-alcohol dehydrogenase-like predicted oxidoreductase [Croceibacterium atlanticum]
MTRSIAGTELHPVGLGCMNLSWAYATPPAHDDCVAFLNRSLDLGYNHLDTARIYGAGKNEALIGEALKGRRKEFFLASKTGIIVDGPKRGIDCSPAHIEEDIDKSLELLGTDHIDLYYMHRFDPKVPIADSVGAFQKAIEAGKISAYGVSEWSSAHIREAHAVHPVGAVQTEYSLWTRNVELGVLDTCKELGIPFVAFSPVARGALGGVLKDPSTLEEKDLRTKMPRFNAENWPKNLKVIEEFNALAEGAGITPAQLSLAWVLSRGGNVHVIPGTTNLRHLEDNYNAGNLDVSTDVLEEADRLINHQTISGHRYHDAIRPTIDTEEFEPA